MRRDRPTREVIKGKVLRALSPTTPIAAVAVIARLGHEITVYAILRELEAEGRAERSKKPHDNKTYWLRKGEVYAGLQATVSD